MKPFWECLTGSTCTLCWNMLTFRNLACIISKNSVSFATFKPYKLNDIADAVKSKNVTGMCMYVLLISLMYSCGFLFNDLKFFSLEQYKTTFVIHEIYRWRLISSIFKSSDLFGGGSVCKSMLHGKIVCKLAEGYWPN